MPVIYPEGLMHKKVNIWIALLLIAVLAASAAYFISVRAFAGIGVNILGPPITCTLDPFPASLNGTCLLKCPICGNIRWQCTGLSQVDALYLSGINSLYQGSAFCLANPVPPNGGTFRPGGQCLGGVTGFGPHVLFNFGCTP